MSTINGTTGDDSLLGTTGNDRINAGDGRDTVNGGLGDDTILGGTGLDSLFGSDGDDRIFTGDNLGYGMETIDGGAGDDIVTVQGRNANVEGGDGFDIVRAVNPEQGVVQLHGVERFIGGRETDFVTAQYDVTTAETLLGGGGADFILSGSGDDLLRGGTGDDTLNAYTGHDTIYGGAGLDRVSILTLPGQTVSLRVTGPQDIFSGTVELHGVEAISASGGVHLIGGPGSNELIARGGESSLEGGLGNDVLVFANGGSYTLDGGVGNDVVSVRGFTVGAVLSLEDQGGAVTVGQATVVFHHMEGLSGGSGGDLLTGDVANNLLAGDFANDTLIGGDGSDTLYGDSRAAGKGVVFYAPVDGSQFTYDDELHGGLGADELHGELGSDKLFGDVGADTLIGGAGQDQLTGGAGADTFVFSATSDTPAAPDGSGADLITDLQPGDTIDLSGIDADVSTAADDVFHLVAAFSGTAGEAVIAFDAAANLSRLQLDVDGDGQGDAVIGMTGDQTGFSNFVL